MGRKKKTIGIGLDELIKKSLEASDVEKKINELEREIKSLYDEIGKLENENKILRRELENAEGLNKKSADYYFKKGLEMDKKGDYPYASYYYIRALEIDPEHIKALINLGTMYYEFELDERAIEIFEEVLKLDPTNEIAKENLKILKEEEE